MVVIYMHPLSAKPNLNMLPHYDPFKPDEDIVSVHSALVTGGYIACLISAIFGVVLVVLSPGPVNPDSGSLRYISEGMEAHCGWATVVLGTCSLLVMGCQLVAAAHMIRRNAMAYALAQVIGWNVVLGVSDTGWDVHYVGLALFLAGGLMYHYIASRDPSYGGVNYVRLNALGWLFSLVFGSLAFASKMAGDGATALRSFAVAFEFVLLLFLVLQNAFLIHSLDQFRDIRLRFERYYSNA
jgi:hypothetical protein